MIREKEDVLHGTVAFLTGKRGGYGAMVPTLLGLRSAGWDVKVIATDQHLLSDFGNTIELVRREFPDALALGSSIFMPGPVGRAESLGHLRAALPSALFEINPSVLFLYGDRGESLEAASVATIMGIPIAHFQGGDVSGSVDEQVRHALTKLAHIHFPASQASANRILQMGEEHWRVRVVGDSHLDPIKLGLYAEAKEVRETLGIRDDEDPVLVLQHSETTQVEMAHHQMYQTLLAASHLQGPKIIVLPSTDVGADAILETVKEFDGGEHMQVVANLDSRLFLGLLRISKVFLGNSSAGVIEAPFMNVPSVSIGRRQEGREAYGPVIYCQHKAESIVEAAALAIAQAPTVRHRCIPEMEHLPTSVEKVTAGLHELLPDERLLVKRFVDR